MTYKTYIWLTVQYAATVRDRQTSRNIDKLEQVTSNHDYSSSSVSAMIRTVDKQRRYSASLWCTKFTIDWSTWMSLHSCSHYSPVREGTHLAYSNCTAYSDSYIPRTIRDWNVLGVDPLKISVCGQLQAPSQLSPICPSVPSSLSRGAFVLWWGRTCSLRLCLSVRHSCMALSNHNHNHCR